MIATNIVIELNDTTYTAIEVAEDLNPKHGGRVYTYWLEGGDSYLQATSDAGLGEAVIPVDAIFVEANISAGIGNPLKGRVLFYAKSISGIPNIVVKTGATHA